MLNFRWVSSCTHISHGHPCWQGFHDDMNSWITASSTDMMNNHPHLLEHFPTLEHFAVAPWWQVSAYRVIETLETGTSSEGNYPCASYTHNIFFDFLRFVLWSWWTGWCFFPATGQFPKAPQVLGSVAGDGGGCSSYMWKMQLFISSWKPCQHGWPWEMWMQVAVMWMQDDTHLKFNISPWK